MSTNCKKVMLIVVILLSELAFGPVVRAEDCNEARKWYLDGLALSDNSEREASYYRQAINLCPDFFEAHNKLGEVHKNRGEYELAIKEFQQASRSSSFVEPHNNLGEIYRMQGRYDLAAEEFTKVMKIEPDFRDAQNQLKYVQKRLGQYDDAIEAPPGLIPISIFARIPGMTLPKGSFVTDLQYKFWNQEGDVILAEAPPLFSARERDADVHVLIWGIRYGLTNTVTIGLIPKYFLRTSQVSIPLVGIDAEPSVRGIGDTVFLTKHRVWSRRRAHLSAFHLLSIPTGDEDAEGKDGIIVRRIPLGSGSYSFSPGLALTAVIDPMTIHANIWYVIKKDSPTRKGGDEFRCDLALALPEFHRLISIVELNYRWQDEGTRRALTTARLLAPPTVGPPDERVPGGPITSEVTLIEEGGHTLFLSPGVQVFLTKDLKAELGFQFPVIRPSDGFVEEFVFHVGLVKYFF